MNKRFLEDTDVEEEGERVSGIVLKLLYVALALLIRTNIMQLAAPEGTHYS